MQWKLPSRLSVMRHTSLLRTFSLKTAEVETLKFNGELVICTVLFFDHIFDEVGKMFLSDA